MGGYVNQVLPSSQLLSWVERERRADAYPLLVEVVRDLIGPRIGETKRAQLAGPRQRARAVLKSLGEGHEYGAYLRD